VSPSVLLGLDTILDGCGGGGGEGVLGFGAILDGWGGGGGQGVVWSEAAGHTPRPGVCHAAVSGQCDAVRDGMEETDAGGEPAMLANRRKDRQQALPDLFRC
jgi:hypothetical protein